VNSSTTAVVVNEMWKLMDLFGGRYRTPARYQMWKLRFVFERFQRSPVSFLEQLSPATEAVDAVFFLFRCP
jgi:hypothetical protein